MATKNYRTERINGDLVRELNLIIANDIKDPLISESIVSVTKADVTKDLKEAKIYVKIEEDEKAQRKVLKALQKASGFLRSELSQIMSTYTSPALTFKLDKSDEYREQIENILSTLRENGEISDTLPEEETDSLSSLEESF